jgi:hypothetical protein
VVTVSSIRMVGSSAGVPTPYDPRSPLPMRMPRYGEWW